MGPQAYGAQRGEEIGICGQAIVAKPLRLYTLEVVEEFIQEPPLYSKILERLASPNCMPHEFRRLGCAAIRDAYDTMVTVAEAGGVGMLAPTNAIIRETVGMPAEEAEENFKLHADSGEQSRTADLEREYYLRTMIRGLLLNVAIAYSNVPKEHTKVRDALVAIVDDFLDSADRICASVQDTALRQKVALKLPEILEEVTQNMTYLDRPRKR